MKNRLTACIPLLLLAFAGCDQQPASGLDVVKMQIGNTTFTLEVADRQATTSYGLMYRDSMPADHGMIFVFPQERKLEFYMRNTKIPLDIIFVDAAGKVVSIHQMKPMDESVTASDGPAKYAIELNKGRASATGIKPGDQLTIPPRAREPQPIR